MLLWSWLHPEERSAALQSVCQQWNSLLLWRGWGEWNDWARAAGVFCQCSCACPCTISGAGSGSGSRCCHCTGSCASPHPSTCHCTGSCAGAHPGTCHGTCSCAGASCGAGACASCRSGASSCGQRSNCPGLSPRGCARSGSCHRTCSHSDQRAGDSAGAGARREQQLCVPIPVTTGTRAGGASGRGARGGLLGAQPRDRACAIPGERRAARQHSRFPSPAATAPTTTAASSPAPTHVLHERGVLLRPLRMELELDNASGLEAPPPKADESLLSFGSLPSLWASLGYPGMC